MLKEREYLDCIEAIYAWMDGCIPKWTELGSNQAKLAEEMKEWLEDPNDEELADVFIALIFGARQRGFDFPAEIMKKVKKNIQRRWVWDEEAQVYHHAPE